MCKICKGHYYISSVVYCWKAIPSKDLCEEKPKNEDTFEHIMEHLVTFDRAIVVSWIWTNYNEAPKCCEESFDPDFEFELFEMEERIWV